LRLRDWSLDDLAPLAEVFAKPQVWHFPFRRGFSLAETEAFLLRRIEEQESRGWSLRAAEDRETRRLIGYIGLSEPDFLPELMPSIEIGWRLDPVAWGRGLATEGARAALAFGFEDLGLDRVVSICEPDNVSSSRVMHRLGMSFDRATVDPLHGVPLCIYRLEQAEWEAADLRSRVVKGVSVHRTRGYPRAPLPPFAGKMAIAIRLQQHTGHVHRAD